MATNMMRQRHRPAAPASSSSAPHDAAVGSSSAGQASIEFGAPKSPDLRRPKSGGCGGGGGTKQQNQQHQHPPNNDGVRTARRSVAAAAAAALVLLVFVAAASYLSPASDSALGPRSDGRGKAGEGAAATATHAHNSRAGAEDDAHRDSAGAGDLRRLDLAAAGGVQPDSGAAAEAAAAAAGLTKAEQPTETKATLVAAATTGAKEEETRRKQRRRKSGGRGAPYRRFPRYGTPEFDSICRWTTMTTATTTAGTASTNAAAHPYDCTLLARPTPSSNEGLSTWTAEISTGHVFAVQANYCRLVLDYGSGVNVGHVFRRPMRRGSNNGNDVDGEDDGEGDIGNQLTNWSIPDGYECKRTEGCFHVGLRSEKSVDSLARDIESVRRQRLRDAEKEARRRRGKQDTEKKGQQQQAQAQEQPRPNLTYIPHYRNAYNPLRNTPAERDAALRIELSPSLPGYRYDLGMACSLNRLLELNPPGGSSSNEGADRYVPGLHGRILPTLRDEGAFVVAIYIRTGNTDEMARAEKAEREAGGGGGDVGGDGGNKIAGGKAADAASSVKLSSTAQGLIRCALALEEDQVVGSSSSSDADADDAPYSRSVWMIITDSPAVGRAVVASYGGVNVTTATTTTSGKKEVQQQQGIIKREVLTTSTRGIQTRPTRSPQTSEFAEASIDWYLLGESDAVVSSGGYTFAATGALRTARPFYVVNNGCERRRAISTGRRRGGGGADIDDGEEEEGDLLDFGSELKDSYRF